MFPMKLYPLTLFSLIAFATILSACSIESAADKILPDRIQQENFQIVDAIMERDAQFFIKRKADLLAPDLLDRVSDREFSESIVSAFSANAASTEISRHIVGVSANVRGSLSEGSAKTYETIYELETSEGFVLISLRLANRSGTNDCCEIKSLDVRDFEASPIRARQALSKRMLTYLGIFLFGLFGALGFFFIRLRKKKKASPTT